MTDFCELTGATLQLIDAGHPLSPPYPEGQEIPDEDYDNYQNHGSRTWANNEQSRPWACYVKSLDLLLTNIFHYGFRERTAYIDHQSVDSRPLTCTSIGLKH